MLKLDDLKKAAIDLNTTLGLEPQIDPEWDEVTLIAALRKAGELVVPQDPLARSTIKVLHVLGCLAPEVIAKHCGKETVDELSTTKAEEDQPQKEVKKEAATIEEKVKGNNKRPLKPVDIDKASEEVAKTVGGRRRSLLVPFIEEKIQEGRYTAAELVEAAIKQFGKTYKKRTIEQVIQSAKSGAHCRLKRLAWPDENGRWRFLNITKEEAKQRGLKTVAQVAEAIKRGEIKLL